MPCSVTRSGPEPCYVSGRIVGGIYIWLGLERGSGRANWNWCARAGRLVVSR